MSAKFFSHSADAPPGSVPMMKHEPHTRPVNGPGRTPAGGCPEWIHRGGGVFALLLAIVTSALMLVNPGAASAQGRPPQGLPGGLFGNKPELFAGNGRIKLLVMGLSPNGITESAAEQISLILQQDLVNTSHFDVVGPREMNTHFEGFQPHLVDCREIACGVESGKLLGAHRVLVGILRLEEPTFILEVRMIDPTNNLTDYEEELRFTDANMEERLFRLANRISDNSLLVGRVLNTSIRGIVIDLGKVNGIKLGNHLVIYRQDMPITDLEGRQIDTQRKNVAIVKVLNVNENSSEAIIIHKTEDTQVGQFAQTYLDPVRQIELVENTRKELDTGIRLANRIRPLELAPVLLSDGERKAWQRRLLAAETNRDMWLTVGGVGAGAVVLVLMNFKSDLTRILQLTVAGGATGYGFWQWDLARKEVNDIQVEGRAKGYNQVQVLPEIHPGYAGVRLALRF